MAALTAIAAIGLGLAGAGAVVGFMGNSQAADAQHELIAAQQHAEQIRNQAMELDAERRRRVQIRDGIIRRSQALATATSQGANESSGLQSAYGQITGNTSFAVAGINSAEKTGNELYQANLDALTAQQHGADAQELQQFGKGLSSLGGSLINNLGTISNLGGNLGGSILPYGGGKNTFTINSFST